jgi:hypothetical protein
MRDIFWCFPSHGLSGNRTLHRELESMGVYRLSQWSIVSILFLIKLKRGTKSCLCLQLCVPASVFKQMAHLTEIKKEMFYHWK